jgi:hypothetical protein
MAVAVVAGLVAVGAVAQCAPETSGPWSENIQALTLIQGPEDHHRHEDRVRPISRAPMTCSLQKSLQDKDCIMGRKG